MVGGVDGAVGELAGEVVDGLVGYLGAVGLAEVSVLRRLELDVVEYPENFKIFKTFTRGRVTLPLYLSLVVYVLGVIY